MKFFFTLEMLVAVAMLVALPASTAAAVTLIDQRSASTGNVTPGDAPGFPVTITQPGSYLLAGNLTVPNANTTAIEIASDHVTLDLNGFAILGPTDCSGGFPCVGAGTGSGVETVPNRQSTPRFNVTVRNGTIQGMGRWGIHMFGDSNLVENVSARSNGFNGIDLRSSFDEGASTVRHSMAQRNGIAGIVVAIGRANANTASGNGSTGIAVIIGSASHNFSTRNRGPGLNMSHGSYYGNSFYGNQQGAVSGGVNQGQNLCDAAPCPGAQF